jgi:hypothetical protein
VKFREKFEIAEIRIGDFYERSRICCALALIAIIGSERHLRNLLLPMHVFLF